jgi:phasin family protein
MQNVASAFAFERRLLQVKDPQDLFMLQTEFIRTQMQAMAEQAKGLSETATKSMMESVKIPPKGGLSS